MLIHSLLPCSYSHWGVLTNQQAKKKISKDLNKQQATNKQKKGFKKAVIELTLEKYKEKLDKIKESITDEMNGGQSQKRLRTLKESREHILNKYYKLTQKLTNE